MSDTSIEWTDVTWNPVRGCSRVSPGCGGSDGGGCYAERIASRFSGAGQPYEGLTRSTAAGPRWTGKVQLVPDKLEQPLRWRTPRRIFVNSMSDLFHEDVPDEYIAAVFGVMAAAPQHTFQVLTKRADRMRTWFEWYEGTSGAGADSHAAILAAEEIFRRPIGMLGMTAMSGVWPLPNAWLGVSVESQEYADARIPLLLRTPAAVRFVSAEPLLGPLNLCAVPDYRTRVAEFSARNTPLGDLDWVIVGGESGPGARPCDVSWIRSIVEQCKAAGVACFTKQLGANVIHDGIVRPGQQWGRPGMGNFNVVVDGESVFRKHLIDRKGGDIAEWPEDLRVREMPGGAA